MKFLQINLNHCEVAQSLLEQNIIEKNVDMTLIMAWDRTPGN